MSKVKIGNFTTKRAQQEDTFAMSYNHDLYRDAKRVVDQWANQDKDYSVEGIPCLAANIVPINKQYVDAIKNHLADAIKKLGLYENTAIASIDIGHKEDIANGTIQFQLQFLNKANGKENKRLFTLEADKVLDALQEALHIGHGSAAGYAM